MQKILIIAYFFPPCNLTASRRVESFAKYLHCFGIYPIIVTRKWEKEIKSPSDILQRTSSQIEVIQNDNYEVHYLPYKPCLRDKLFQKQSKIFKLTSKILTFFQILAQFITVKAIPFNNIYYYSLSIIKVNKIKKVVISANPFEIFKFGHLLNKKTGIKWIADYRDDWNTSELPEYTSKNPIVRKIETFYEKKWLSTSSAITSISDYYTRKLNLFLNKPAFTIQNGFDFEINMENNQNYFEDFTIVYNGSLYDSQNIELFISAYLDALNALKDKNIKLLFPGLAFNPSQANRIRMLLTGYEKHYEITERMPFEEVIKIQQKAHLMLMVPHTGIKGIPSSKLYEYIGLGKKVLLCPSDYDIIEQTLIDTDSGVFLNKKESISEFLVNAVVNQVVWEKNSLDEKRINKINRYSRRAQTALLADIIKNL
ncbi:MAG: hypothetical protein PHW82_12885 [Bacteroidales bacterium]|nr:hypothetical protein [Bacteroidales bacterium]